MSTIYNVFGFIWVLPVSILIWIFLGILYLFRQISEIRVDKDLAFVWEVASGTWFYRVGGGWWGWSAGNNVILYSDVDKARKSANYIHEKEHVVQQYAWGIFFFPAYIVESVSLWLLKKNKHSYYCNHFERGAREAAGQPIDIPKKEWRDGPNDRWAWW